MGRKERFRQNRLEEYMTKFDTIGVKEAPETCDISGDFEFCMIVTDDNAGNSKKHYFDDRGSISAILSNYKHISNDYSSSSYTYKIYDKKNDEWKSIL